MQDAGHIAFDGVSVVREGRTVLRDITLSLTARSIAVVGANGSGKSSFARTLNGLVPISSGILSVHGLDPSRDGKAVRQRVGMVFSNPAAQVIMPTVREDLAFTLRGRKLSRDEISARVDAALEKVGMAGLADSSVYSLSGGQQQLVALAAVLIGEPSLIVADEPTALLDLGNAKAISRILLDEFDAQVVLVTHDLDLAKRCEYALCFADGRLADAGEPAAVVERYRRTYA
ncbi:energy-coupling factor ABC transporter ATP-binding protein [Gulosibacter molinativorax]|uniref:ABC transporter ATP-binding protein n=1 Tax=Gulosibacter molinativorax TaxID=256821 RepID=A0ABT7C8R7_9MICO|nr:ABC transporter ATP-binding protein [Gulosibacter molinativorax]MDJ1371127.1 ABC transporter ATP-binding protein [Gulosibacter molinativorax]QUY61487.1 Biotin transport ATP-binding protein BioM [Gulosibacter molinativorax]